MKYTELKKKHRTEVENFPMFFAFNDKQFKEGMKKLGLKENDLELIIELPGTGGYLKKEDYQKFSNMMTEHKEELKKLLMTDDEFCLNSLVYELENHEYCITGDTEDALRALNLTKDMVYNDRRLVKILKQATRKAGECIF
jgi:hypothetical protein